MCKYVLDVKNKFQKDDLMVTRVNQCSGYARLVVTGYNNGKGKEKKERVANAL